MSKEETKEKAPWELTRHLHKIEDLMLDNKSLTAIARVNLTVAKLLLEELQDLELAVAKLQGKKKPRPSKTLEKAAKEFQKIRALAVA